MPTDLFEPESMPLTVPTLRPDAGAPSPCTSLWLLIPTSEMGHLSSRIHRARPLLCWLARPALPAGRCSLGAPCPWKGGVMQRSRGAGVSRETAAGVPGQGPFRPQLRKKREMRRRQQKRRVRRDCSKRAIGAWAAASGGGSPPSPAPSAPAGSGPPPSGTTQVATGASRNTPGFLEQIHQGLVR